MISSSQFGNALGVLVPVWGDGDRWAGNPDDPLAVADVEKLAAAWSTAKSGPLPPDLVWRMCLAVSENELWSLLQAGPRWIATAWFAEAELPASISLFKRLDRGQFKQHLQERMQEHQHDLGVAEPDWAWLASLSFLEAQAILAQRS